MQNNLIKSIKNSLVGATVLLVGAFVAPSSFAGDKINGVVAIVNDDVITRTELNTKFNILLSRMEDVSDLPPKDVLDRQVLHKVVLDKLQLQLAKSRDMTVSAKDVNDTIQNIAKNQNLNLQEFKEKLQADGISYVSYRNNVKEQLLISDLQQKEVGLDTNVSDAEVDSFLSSPLGQDLNRNRIQIRPYFISIPRRKLC